MGDARYLDCESPRGVQVRMVPREGPPSVELVSLNIEAVSKSRDPFSALESLEVPAFEATKKFYERIGSLEETAYNEAEEAPIQKFSVFLKSRVGGPKLLLCPVPDGRLKQRDRDEFVNLVMLAPNAQQTAEAADKAILLAKEEPPQVLLILPSRDIFVCRSCICSEYMEMPFFLLRKIIIVSLWYQVCFLVGREEERRGGAREAPTEWRAPCM